MIIFNILLNYLLNIKYAHKYLDIIYITFNSTVIIIFFNNKIAMVILVFRLWAISSDPTWILKSADCQSPYIQIA